LPKGLTQWFVRWKGSVVSEELEVKELCVDKDVVLLVSGRTGDHNRPNVPRASRNAALATMLLNSGHRGRTGLHAHRRTMVGHVELVEGFLGKPELFVGGERGPSVSFSHAIGSTWAALCRSGASVGIDATDPDEFVGSYPFHRAFHADELELAAVAAAGNRLEAAALLWSAKEAVVKALGCGFHLIGPLDVRILPTSWSRGMAKALVDFSERARARFQTLHDTTVRVASFRESQLWISAALSSRTATRNASPQP
jgi:phosphopantetheinyl transferase